MKWPWTKEKKTPSEDKQKLSDATDRLKHSAHVAIRKLELMKVQGERRREETPNTYFPERRHA